MFKIITLVCCLLILIYYSANGQIKTIKVVVLDTETNLPVENCIIRFKHSNKIITTNSFGQFEYHNITTVKDSIIIEADGYANDTFGIYENGVTDTVRFCLLTRLRLSYSSIQIFSSKTEFNKKIVAVDVHSRPLASSQDALRTVPSLFIAQHAGGGKAEQIFLRGYDIDHGTDIHIQADGLPVNMISHAHGQGYADLHFLLPELIEKINFEKGPYNPEKGNLATAGFVDFKTIDFLKNNNIKLEAGLFNSKRISGLFKIYEIQRRQQREQLYVGSEWMYSDGYFESAQNFKRKNLTAKYSLFKTNKTKLQILFSGFNSKWNASGQIPERAVNDGRINSFGAIDNLEGGSTGRTNLTVKHMKPLRENIFLDQQAYYIRYRFDLFSNFTFFLNDTSNGDMINQRENRSVYGYLGKIKKAGTWGNIKTNTVFGTGFRLDAVKDIGLFNSPARIYLSTIQNGSIRELNIFTYLDKLLEVSNNFTINASVRYDYFNFGYKNKFQSEDFFTFQNKGIFSPKVSMSYKVNSRLNLFLNNGFGFHSNDTRVILNRDVSKILPRVFGTDFGFITKPVSNFFIKTALWHLYSQQEFIYVGDAGIVEPSGKSRRFGIEMATRYQYNKWLFADIDWSYTRARAFKEEKGKDYIALAPVWTSTGGITMKYYEKWNISLRYRFLGNRSANSDNSLVAKGYFLMDAVIQYNRKNFSFQMTAENIWNQQWKETQFETTSLLKNENEPATGIHFTPGTPFALKAGVSISF